MNLNPRIYPRKQPSFRPIFIGCGVMLGVFLIGLLLFTFLFRKVSKWSQEYENSLTTLTGTFETDSLITGPVSGKPGKAVVLDYYKSIMRSGNSGSSSSYEYLLLYPAGAKLNANGQSYTIMGNTMHLYRTSKDLLAAPVLRFDCSVHKKVPREIPAKLKGINRRVDFTLDNLERGSCEGMRTSVSFREYVFGPQDTIRIRGFVRNDTLFLDQ